MKSKIIGKKTRFKRISTSGETVKVILTTILDKEREEEIIVIESLCLSENPETEGKVVRKFFNKYVIRHYFALKRDTFSLICWYVDSMFKDLHIDNSKKDI